MLKSTDEEGKAVSVSHNCAQMDKFMPLLLGVSTAILEYVIFCHQDESNWPFSDQANLKKIFDEVFDTTKYTKAIDELKKVSKKYSKLARDHQHELALKMKTYERYTDSRRRIFGLEQKKLELESSQAELLAEERELATEVTKLRQEQQSLSENAAEMRVLNESLNLQKRELFSVQKELDLDGILDEAELKRREEELENQRIQHARNTISRSALSSALPSDVIFCNR